MAAARKKPAAKRKATAKRAPARKPAPEKRRGGRPTKRTADVEDAIMRSLRVGVARTSAAAIAGIGRNTMNDWLHGDASFRAACEKAEGSARARMAARLFKKGVEDGDVTSMIWWQKCRDPEFREPREQPVHVDVGDRTGHSLISRTIEALARQVAIGEAPASVLEHIAKAMGHGSDVLERADLEDRIAGVKAGRSIVRNVGVPARPPDESPAILSSASPPRDSVILLRAALLVPMATSTRAFGLAPGAPAHVSSRA